jgi:hypothetical protein
MQRFDTSRSYRETEEVDYVIVGLGAGAASCPSASRAGFRVEASMRDHYGIPSGIGSAMKPAPVSYIRRISALPAEAIRYRSAQNNSGSGGAAAKLGLSELRARTRQLQRLRGASLMAQAGNVVLGYFDDLIRMYKAPPAHAMTEEFYETDPSRDFARLRDSDRWPSAHSICKTDDDRQRRMGMGPAPDHDGL